MRCVIALAAVISCAGCTTLRPIEGTSTELRQQLNSGALLQTGDRVLIVTEDHKTHRFRVTAVSAGFVEGRAQSVAVDQVVSVQRRQFSRAKTWVLAGAGVLVIGSIAYAISQSAVAFMPP